MDTRDRWIFLILFSCFSAGLFLVTVIIAQLEAFVPRREARIPPSETEQEISQGHHDEPTAA